MTEYYLYVQTEPGGEFRFTMQGRLDYLKERVSEWRRLGFIVGHDFRENFS